MSDTVKQQHKRNLRSTLVEPFKQIKFGVYVIGISVSFVAVCAWMFVAAFTEQYQHVMGIFNVVDDDPALAEMLGIVLRGEGLEPTFVGDGDAALAKFRAGSGYNPEEGESKAHTFHWIRNLAALAMTERESGR